MAKKYTTYWYQEGPEFKQAFLYNLRDNDVQKGGSIEQGEIVQGAEGLIAAETTVFGWTGRILPFKPNRRCEWQGLELPCMTQPVTPGASVAAIRLGVFNYAVVPVTSEAVKAAADSLKMPCVRNSQGAWVFNVELTRFSGQDSRRRAKLI